MCFISGGDITNSRSLLGWRTCGEIMMATVKALIPGFFLTFVICAVMAHAEVHSAPLALERATLGQHDFYWSWPLFTVTFFLSRALYWVIGD